MSKIDDDQPNAERASTDPLYIPQHQLQFLEDAKRVELESPDDRNEVGYSARLWAQLSLPYKNPGDIAKWQRRNGAMALTMYPAELMDTEGNYYSGYPYGLLPRYLLTWMATEAVRVESRKLWLGENLADFMRKLDLSPTGGQTGTIRQLNDQMRRLFGSTLKVTEHTLTEGVLRDHGKHMSLASEWDLFFSRKDPESAPLFESSITLSQEFFDEIDKSGFPIDMGAVNALRKRRSGPMAFDMYVWLCSRLWRIDARRPAHISWKQLSLQFGSDTRRMVDFRRKFLKRLEAVQFVYPEARIEADTQGVVLYRSPPSVPQKKSVRKRPSSKKRPSIEG